MSLLTDTQRACRSQIYLRRSQQVCETGQHLGCQRQGNLADLAERTPLRGYHASSSLSFRNRYADFLSAFVGADMFR